MSEKKEHLLKINQLIKSTPRVFVPQILELLPEDTFTNQEKGHIITLLKANFPDKIVERRVSGDLSRILFEDFIHLLEKKDDILFTTIITDAITKSDGQVLNVVMKNIQYIYPDIFNKYINDENMDEFVKVSNVILYKFNDIFCQPLKMLLPKKSFIKKMDKSQITGFITETVDNYSKLIEDIRTKNQSLAIFFIDTIEKILKVYFENPYPLIKQNETELTKHFKIDDMKHLFIISLKYWLYFNWFKGEDPMELSENVNNMVYILCSTITEFKFNKLSLEDKKLLAFSLALFLYCKGSHKKRNIIKEYVSKKEIVFFRYHIYFEGLIRNIFT